MVPHESGKGDDVEEEKLRTPTNLAGVKLRTPKDVFLILWMSRIGKVNLGHP